MKVDIIGDAFVITSSLSVEDILFLATNAPDRLVVRNKTSKDDKEIGKEVFRASYNADAPGIFKFENSSGITFGGKTRDLKGLATFTEKIRPGTVNAKEYVADKIAAIYEYLPQLEKEIPLAISEYKEKREELLALIKEAGDSSSEASENRTLSPKASENYSAHSKNSGGSEKADTGDDDPGDGENNGENTDQ